MGTTLRHAIVFRKISTKSQPKGSSVAIPASKDALLDAINTNFAKLMADLGRVPAAQARHPALAGHAAGSLISPADLVAYLIGWNRLVLKWLSRDDCGQAVDFPETAYRWNQLGALAQKFYKDYQDIAWPELLSELTAAKADLVQTIKTRSNEELYGQPWYGKWTKGRMIQLNSASPYANARQRIRKYLRDQA